MTEEDISSNGQFTALSAAEVVTSYQPSSGTAQAGIAAPRRAPVVAESAPSASVAQFPKQSTTHEIDSAIAAANANLASANRQMDYQVDSATGMYIALIRNSQTGEIVQQIPGADLVALARLLADWAPGKHVLFDIKA